MTSPAHWLAGARPRTLPAAVAPVLAGTGVAAYDAEAVWWKALLALVVALALQVGVNYANDYSDGIRGTDDDRVGPLRLVGSGLASPRAVKLAAFAAFGVAGVAGLVLAATTAWWLVAVGLLAILAAWFYTGGSTPYGYHGLGEVMVFVFFGLVAVLGTTYVQTEAFAWAALYAAVGIGALACAILVVNNLRDIPTDAEVGKRTLAVRLGAERTRGLYALLVLAAAARGGRRRRRHDLVGPGGPGVPARAGPGGADGPVRRHRPRARARAPEDRPGRARLGGPRRRPAVRRRLSDDGHRERRPWSDPERPPRNRGRRPRPTYAGDMWFLILVALVVAGVVAYKMRVPLLAKILGQPESRIDRRLNGPK